MENLINYFADSSQGMILLGEIALVVFAFLMPNEKLRAIGKFIGRSSALFLRQKLGRDTGQRADRWLSATLDTIVGGIKEGIEEVETQQEGGMQ